MLQTALIDKSGQQPKSQVAIARTLIAPIKGWYVGTPVAAAPEETAILLENAFPEIDAVRARGGSTTFSSGMPAAVNTLMPYRVGGNYKMFAASGGNIYDVTGGGAVGAALVTGLNSSARFSYIQFSATGNQTLLAANGIDPVQLYNGTWGTTPAITGLTGNPLNFLWTFQSNIWALQSGSLDSWYLPGSAIGGAITKYPMSPLFRRGGTLMAGGTWTIQSTAGLKYANVFVTDQGEVAIFTGSTPSFTDWTLVGVYQISPPVGPRCILQAGGDLAIMTTEGITAISAVTTTDQIALQNVSATVAIQPAWQAATQARSGLFAWQIIEWPMRTMVIVMMPATSAEPTTQFVGNGRTGAWCRYVGWDARCFEIGGANLDKLLYGSGDGRVMQAESGGMDDGKSYSMTIFPSFTDLSKTDIGYPSLSQSADFKQTKMVRPRLQAMDVVNPQVTMRTDYNKTVPSPPPPSFGVVSGAIWGTDLWGVGLWAQQSFSNDVWLPAFGIGSTISPVVQLTFNQVATPQVRLASIDILFEAGGIYG